MHISRRVFGRLLLSTSLLTFACSQARAYSLLTRSEWGAAPPLEGLIDHEPVRITIHHTGVAANPSRSLAEKLVSLQGFSQRSELLADGRVKDAWADIPYHFYVGANGNVAEGRAVEFVGDTNTNYDPTGHIGIAVEGNFNIETPSDDQIDALVQLIRELKGRFEISITNIETHLDFAQTACPGTNMTLMVPLILARVGN